MTRSLFTFTWVSLILFFGAGFSAQARPGLPDFTDLVKQVAPAVVNISTTQKLKMTHKRPPRHGGGPEDPRTPFDEWYRHFFGEEGEVPHFDAKSLGSGFIISKDGYVLTNHHVVDGADEIIVKLRDRRELVAKLIGSDKKSDVAVLKVSAKDLPVVKIGSAEKLKVGEWVLAIGSPFNFDYSVTAGIVSYKGRWLPSENYVPFIQTDVAINPGNSGGPLFNLDGEVVGVNSQIYSRTGGFMGLSFAIPIDLVMEVVDQLKSDGKVVRGWLGVLIQPVTRELAESFGMDKPLGALVARVMPDSTAEKAGFQVGDIVVHFNGKEIYENSDLPPMVGRTKVKQAVNVTVIRNGKKVKLKVTIGELPGDEEIRAARTGKDKSQVNRLGAIVRELDDEIRERLDLEKDGGVLVEKITGGPAQEAGLRSGDIILRINNKEISNINGLQRVIKDIPPGKSVPLLVHRRNGPVFLALKIGDSE